MIRFPSGKMVRQTAWDAAKTLCGAEKTEALRGNFDWPIVWIISIIGSKTLSQ